MSMQEKLPLENEMDSMNNEENDDNTADNYDTDTLLNEIEKTDDLDVLDDLYNKLQTEFLRKTQLLKNIRQQNAEMKCELNSSKYFLSELEQLQSDGQQKTKNLREMIEAKQAEREHLHLQKIDDLVLFENAVQEITEKFKNAPKDYESNSLMENVMELQSHLENNIIEITKYKQDLQAAEDKFKETQADNSCQDLPLKVFEESVNDISSLNNKLSSSLEQITKKVNGLRFEISNLNIYKRDQKQ
uniref:Uncharacterized protein n=1 Tax=Graphocephala atropunctata TaxID=36148 RepID=A0A1B6LSG8_9HEMI